MKRDVRTHLEDADKAVEEIADFTSGTDLDEYLGNRMMQKAAEHLAKAVMGRHGLDARHSHDLHRLADQARNAGHDALAEDFRRMNGATRTDHVARYDGATKKSLARAIERLPVVLDLMRKELADIPESFLDPEQAGRLADAVAPLASRRTWRA